MERCVLVADRDRGLAHAIQRCLAAHEIPVEIAHDGLQCLTALQTFAPAVLLLDSVLLWGGADGVLEWLNDENPLQPPAVILAEDPEFCTLPAALSAKAACRIRRPSSLKTLLPFVNQLIECIHKTQSANIDSMASLP